MQLLVILLILWGFVSHNANAQNQKKEYITFSDTKGEVIDCKGRAGFQGATLTIRYPTLAAYQKQYSKHYLVLDPDPPKNLTLEQRGFDGPCSRYEKKEMALGGYPRLHGMAREFPEKMEIMYCKDGIYHFLYGVKNGKFSSVYHPKDKCTLDESKTQDLYGRIGPRPSSIAIEKFQKNWPQPSKSFASTIFCGEDGKRYSMVIFTDNVPNPIRMDDFNNKLLNSCNIDPTINELAPERLSWPE